MNASQIKIIVVDNNQTEHKLKYYLDWISIENKAEIKLISMREENAIDELDFADGIIFTGGSDVSGEFYKSEKPELINKTDFERDNFEKKILIKALNLKMPVIGICRGLQFVNVILEGTLYEDLESYGFTKHSIENESEHKLKIVENSLMKEIVNQEFGSVNSSHHQAIRKIGNGLIASSFSDDNVIESLEWENKTDKSFLLLVQWHPERMKNMNSPFSKNIREKFLSEVNNYSKTKQRGKNEIN